MAPTPQIQCLFVAKCATKAVKRYNTLELLSCVLDRMTVSPQKTPPTIADYKAAEARLREVRDEAAAGMRASQDRGDAAAGDEWATRLKNEFDNFKAFREGLPPDVLLSIHAERILESFSVDKDGFVNLVIPADVSDEEAMHALNVRFREMFPDKQRAAIYEPDIEQILDAGGGCGRISRAPRIIRLIGVVPGTKSKTRDQQAGALHEKGLTFPHPIDQALAAAAYACKRKGEDLFKDLAVRGSVPGFSLATFGHCGVVVFGINYGDAPDSVASGSPSPELK